MIAQTEIVFLNKKYYDIKSPLIVRYTELRDEISVENNYRLFETSKKRATYI